MPLVEQSQGELTFTFEKANSFRVIYADGAVGAVSPNGRVMHMSLYNERAPIPQSVTNQVVNGTLGAEVVEKRVSKQGLFREVEVDVILTVDAATALRDWLGQQIDQAVLIANMNAQANKG